VDKWYRRRNRSHCRWKSCQRREIRFGNDTFHPHVSYSQGQERHLYVKVVVIDKPNKEIKQRAGFTAGGVKSVYTGENCSTKSADLTSAKKILNSAKFMTWISRMFTATHPWQSAHPRPLHSRPHHANHRFFAKVIRRFAFHMNTILMPLRSSSTII
jgi:hypothetical protein